MTEPLLSEAELDSLAEVAERGMRSTVQIFHKTDVSNDYSDDGESYPGEPDATVIGWFRVQPDFSVTDEFAAFQHIDDGRLFVPRAVALARGDKIVVNGEAFTVIDVNTPNTYRVLTRAAVRRMD